MSDDPRRRLHNTEVQLAEMRGRLQAMDEERHRVLLDVLSEPRLREALRRHAWVQAGENVGLVGDCPDGWPEGVTEEAFAETYAQRFSSQHATVPRTPEEEIAAEESALVALLHSAR